MRSPKQKFKSLLLGCVVILLIAGPVWASSGEIVKIDFSPANKSLTIKSKGPLGKHNAKVIGGPNRLVLDIQDTALGDVPRKINGEKSEFHEIRVGTFKTAARVVVDFRGTPVPPYNVNRSDDQLTITFGNSLKAELAKPESSDEKPEKAASSLDPSFVPAAANSSGIEVKSPTAPAFTAQPAMNKPGPREAKADNKVLAARDVKVAQADVRPAPPKGAEPGPPPPGSPIPPAGPPPPGSSSQGPVPSGGAQMVREVKPPVTPPTPDPRLLVQEITELRFTQVGHNSRLMIRGGDHLDYRLTKVSPTKARLDLINAEIPKAHQKPLRTDLFTTSVEMIVPGSQTIFIQLKDAVPYQVEKQKGILMVDFPPPRFTIPSDQGGKPRTDLEMRESAERERQRTREDQQRYRLTILNRERDALTKDMRSLQQQVTQQQEARNELVKKFQIAPDPETFNKPVTMDFQGITLRNAFRLLAEQAGINIIVGNEVQGTTTLRLFQVPLGQVIDTILNTNDLDRIMIGNVMRVGSRNVIQGLKKERREEYENRLKEIDANISNINAQITDKERKVVDLEKSLTQEPEVVEDSKTEEIGEAECVVIGGRNVCFFYTTVTLVYADPAKIVNILKCMFNLDCPGGVSATASSAAQRAVEAETRRVMDQGFSPTGNQGRDRILQAQQASSAQQQAEAQTAQAQTLAQGARLGLGPQQQGSLLDPDLVKIIVHSVLWANADYKRIFIKDTAERIAQMRRVIATLDIPQPQVQVESRIVRAARDWSRGLGILWGGRHTQTRAVGQDKNPMYGITGAAGPTANSPLTAGTAAPPPFPDSSLPASQYMINLPSTAVNSGLSFLFGFAQGNLLDDLELQIQVGEANNLVRTIGRPKVQVLDGQNATIQSGTQIPYGNLLETQFVSATLSLTVTPHIFADGRIQMLVTVTDNAPGATTPTGLVSIDIRNATTTLIAKDGDVIVIGGIVRNTTTDTKNGWPGLMNVPILSTLFSSKTKVKNLEELYFFLCPTIIKRPPAAA